MSDNYPCSVCSEECHDHCIFCEHGFVMAAESNGGSEFVDVLPRSGHVAVSADNFMLTWGGYQEDLHVGDRYLAPKEVNVYHTDLKYWSSHSTGGDVPPGTSGAAGFLVDDRLYIFAGHTHYGNSNSLFRLDLKTLQWTDLSPDDHNESSTWPSPRDKFASWSYENRLYCFGGFGPPINTQLNDSGQYYGDRSTPWSITRGWNNQLIVYDVQTYTWTNPSCRGTLPTPRAAHATVRFGKVVYMFGGRHDDQRMDDLHCLDLQSLTWSGEIYTEGASPCGRSWHTLTAVSDHVAFLYGGYSTNSHPLSDAWQLDISTRQWSQVTVPTDQPRLWHTSCCNEDGEVLVFGGCCNDILEYNEPTIHSSEVLVFLIQPYKLQRLCLDAAFKYRDQTYSGWNLLPKTLYSWLDRKQKVQDMKIERQPANKQTRFGSTCSVS